MMTYLWNWWQGFVTIRLRGPGLERLLNTMTEHHIILFKVERLTDQTMIARLAARDFCRLRPLLWGLPIHVSILQRQGFPFFFRKLKLRAFLGVGLILFMFFMAYLARYIWFIEIQGNETIDPRDLKIVVEELGIHVGAVRSELELQKLESALMTAFPDLSWVQVRLQGVKLEIHLAEREVVSIPQGGVGNVFASRAGVITQVLVLRGTPQVREGDTVLEGDLLISGVYYDSHGRKQNGAAQGIVYAKSWYQGIGESSLIRWEAEKTGKKYRQYKLLLGSYSLPFGPSRDLSNHQMERKEWILSLGNAMVSVGWARIDYEEIRYVAVPLSREESVAQAYDLAWEHLELQGIQADQILNERMTEEPLQDGEGVRVTLWVEVQEDIGQFFGQ